MTRTRPSDWRASVEIEKYPSNIPEILIFLRQSFREEAVGELVATYQIELEGAGGGAFWASVDRGQLFCEEGVIDDPDVEFTMPAGDFYSVLAAKENPELLYMAGKIRVEGSLSLALRLRVMFLAGRASD